MLKVGPEGYSIDEFPPTVLLDLGVDQFGGEDGPIPAFDLGVANTIFHMPFFSRRQEPADETPSTARVPIEDRPPIVGKREQVDDPYFGDQNARRIRRRHGNDEEQS